MADKLFLSRFTPSRTDPQILEQIFVQREPLAKDAEERLLESVVSGNMHHLVFIGPRGSGKTHLVSLIFHRLVARDDLKDRLRIAWLSEDETTTSFLKLLLRIYRALTQRYPDEFEPLPAALQQLGELGRIELLSKLMVESLRGRKLLVVVENTDNLFKGLGEDGEKQWRAFLQENPISTTLATSQQLFDGISRREAPFFGFFQIEYLQPLSFEDAVLLLEKIAELKGDTELAAFLGTPTGRSRVRALHHLSGGNHRIYIILSDFITREALDELVGPFERLMDELTPYYQARLSWLSPQQREIVEFLCRCRYAVPVKEVANQLLISHQTATGQLKEIKEKGYVINHTVGRESRYELAEPLMRLSVEVKENNRHPIRLIVDFLRIWHSRNELTGQLQRLPSDLAPGWKGRGRVLTKLGHHDAAIEWYDHALALNPDDASVASDRITSLFLMDRWDDGFEGLRVCLSRFSPATEQYTGLIESIATTHVLCAQAQGLWKDRLERLTKLYSDAGALTYLGIGLVRSLTSIRKLNPSQESLSGWYEIWHKVSSDKDELSIALRILNVGIRFLQTHDRRVLLDLVQEERQILAEALGLERGGEVSA